MKIRFPVTIGCAARMLAVGLSLLAAPILAHAGGAPAGQPLYHEPATDAEQALDAILKMSKADPNLFFIVLQKPGYDLSKTHEYEALFTADFVAAWKKYERRLIRSYCGGKYIPGKHCGVPEDPVYCDDGVSAKLYPFIYRTVVGDSEEAWVQIMSLADKTQERSFYLRHESDRWELGGMLCEADDPYTIPIPRLYSRFRQPKLDSEKKLEEIFRQTLRDDQSFAFVYDLPWRDPPQDRKFQGLFTPAFLRSAKAHAREILTEEFFGKSGKSIYFGTKFGRGPIGCQMGLYPFRLERTTQEEGNSALIVYTNLDDLVLPPDYGPDKLSIEYRMVKDQGGWKLDGLSCFNPPWEVQINF